MARKSKYPPSVTPGIPRLGRKPNGWITTAFGNVLQVVSRKASVDAAMKYQLVTAKRNRGGIVPRSVLLGKNIKTKTQFFIKSGDFLISRRQIIHGACGIVPPELDGALVSNEYSTLLVKEGLLLDYLKYFCHSVYFQQTCFQSSVGVDVEKMVFDLPGWLKYKVHLPPVFEQECIIEILGTWDRAIALTKKLITAKQKRKQALMRQLLTGKGRFKEFTDEWVTYRLGDLAELTAGGTPSTKVKEYWDGNIRWMNSGEVNLRYVWEVEERITQEGLDNSSAKVIPINSVLIALAGQGKTRGTVAVNKVETATNQSIAAIMPDSSKLDYLYLFFNLDYRYAEMRLISGGNGGRGGLNLTLLKNIEIRLPSLEEQRKTAEVLIACDAELNQIAKNLLRWSNKKRD